MDRRALLQVGTALLVNSIAPTTAAGAAQARPGAQAGQASVHPLGPTFPGWQGSMLEVTMPPGSSSAAHQHPGPTFGFVVSGSIRWAINGEAPQVLAAGERFFEPMGAVHSTSANASDTEPAKLLVVILGKEGEPISKPAPKPAP